MGLLGVFQKLIASKSNDHEGFYLLGSMVEHFEPWVNNGIYKLYTIGKLLKKSVRFWQCQGSSSFMLKTNLVWFWRVLLLPKFLRQLGASGSVISSTANW